MRFSNAGCQTCKDRHIKCDEARPICRKCEKSGRHCHRLSTFIHSENSYASKKNKRPRGPRASPRNEIVIANATDLLRGSLTDLKSQALTYYLCHHLKTLRDAPSVIKAQTDDFSPIWTSRKEKPLVNLSVSATALAVFSQTQRHSAAAVEASTHYHQLLQFVRTKIVSLSWENLEDCLLAIFFMTRFEDVVYRPHVPITTDPFIKTLRSGSHHDGALLILKTWKFQLSHVQPPTAIIKYGRRGVIKSCLLRNRVLPDWLLDGECFGETGLELRFDSIVTRILSARDELSKLTPQTCTSNVTQDLPASLKGVDTELADIIQTLRLWKNGLPTAWQQRKHTVSTTSTELSYDSTVHSYSTLPVAAVWNRLYAIGILASSLRSRSLWLGNHVADAVAGVQQKECRSNIRAMASNLAANIPFCLRWFTPRADSDAVELNPKESIEPHVADLIVWPLTIASSVREVDDKQKFWFRSQLAYAGRIMGVKVLESAETGQWLEL